MTDFKKLVLGNAGRKKVGKWAILGIHGGEEGKDWQKGKSAVAKAQGELGQSYHKIKAKYVGKVQRLQHLNGKDKQKLINQIEEL